MQMLLQVKFQLDPFNAATRDGSVGKKIKTILDDIKPEAAYFTEIDGHRGVMLIVNLDDPSEVPALAEPWFLQFNAECSFHIVMTPDALAKAGIEALGKKWA